MVAYYANLLVRAFLAIPGSLGANWLGLVWPAVVVLVGEIIAGFVYGWRVMAAKWKQATLIGFAALGCCYSILFVCCAISQNYGTVSFAIGKAESLQRLVDTADARQSFAVLKAQSECSRIIGQNDSLSNQNRNQQNLIAGCQQQAIHMLAPEKFEFVNIVWSNETTNGTDHKVSHIFLGNKLITPIHFFIECERPIRDIEYGILGTNGRMGNVKTITPYMVEINIDSPAWTPKSPLKVQYSYTSSKEGIVCGFSERGAN
jgi:hypothetical protein